MELKFHFIGWCNEDNHDKIWGYFSKPGWVAKNYWESEPCYIFWGRRGKAMTFKTGIVDRELGKLKNKKLDKGYVQINEKRMLEIWPTFYDDAEMRLSFCILANKVK